MRIVARTHPNKQGRIHQENIIFSTTANNPQPTCNRTPEPTNRRIKRHLPGIARTFCDSRQELQTRDRQHAQEKIQQKQRQNINLSRLQTGPIAAQTPSRLHKSDASVHVRGRSANVQPTRNQRDEPEPLRHFSRNAEENANLHFPSHLNFSSTGFRRSTENGTHINPVTGDQMREPRSARSTTISAEDSILHTPPERCTHAVRPVQSTRSFGPATSGKRYRAPARLHRAETRKASGSSR